MADLVLPVQKWQPALVTPVTGSLKLAGDGMSAVVTSIDVLTKAGAAILKAFTALLPGTLDPSVIALNLAIEAAKKLVSEFSFADAYLSGLISAPLLGGSGAFFTTLNTKLADSKDPFRPPVNTTDPLTGATKSYYHAGIVGWAEITSPNDVIAVYQAIKNIFGFNPAGGNTSPGLNMFRPAASVRLVGGSPEVRWTHPSQLAIDSGKLTVRAANGIEYAKIKSIKEVRILRRPRPYKGQTTTRVSSQTYRQLVSFYQDTVTSGSYEYAVSFDYALSNGQSITGILSNWAPIDIDALAQSGKFATTGGSYPNFYGVKAGNTIADISKITSQIEKYLSSAQNIGTSPQQEINAYIDFLTAYVTSITTKVSELAGLLNNVAGSLDAIARSGLFFSAYEGTPQSCLAQISGQAGSSTSSSFAIGFLLNASSSNQTLANATVDGIKLMLGITGNYSTLDRLSQLSSAIQRTGTRIVENVTGSLKTITDETVSTPGRLSKLYRFGPDMKPLN